MKNKLALFDLDGTLFDTRRTNWLSYNKALEEFGVSIQYEFFAEKCNGKHYKTFIPDLLKNQEDFQEKTERVHELKKGFYSLFLENAVPNKALFDIIKNLRSEYYTAIVTTASRKNCMELLEKHSKAELFDLILTGEDVIKKKPDPEGFLKAMEHFSVKPEDTLIFEDSEIGLEAAEKSRATVFAARGFA